MKTAWTSKGIFWSASISEKRLTDYSFCIAVIYATFAWSVADEAYKMMRALAQKHKVGFFDVSGSEGEIIWL